MKKIKFLMLLSVAIGLGSCNTARVNSNSLQGEWQLVTMGTTAVTAEAQPTLQLNIKEMKVNGSDSCNTFMGGITNITDKDLVFSELATTLMLCPETTMQVADTFGAAMKKVAKYEVNDNQLLLKDDKGEVLLIFTKK
jgi:hypothetical protein|nr:META domain-containing protein [uncultured Capnocytophaga sp.]